MIVELSFMTLTKAELRKLNLRLGYKSEEEKYRSFLQLGCQFAKTRGALLASVDMPRFIYDSNKTSDFSLNGYIT